MPAFNAFFQLWVIRTALGVRRHSDLCYQARTDPGRPRLREIIAILLYFFKKNS